MDQIATKEEQDTSLPSNSHSTWHKPEINRIDMKRTLWAAGSPADGTSNAKW